MGIGAGRIAIGAAVAIWAWLPAGDALKQQLHIVMQFGPHRGIEIQLFQDILLRVAAAETIHATQRRPHRLDCVGVFPARVRQGSLVVVVGAGGVGGYCVQIAHAVGGRVVAIDVDDAKLDMIGRHGAELTLNAKKLDGKALKAAIGDFARRNGLPATEWFIFECSGTAAGQATAFGLLVHGATLSVVGFTMDKVEVRLSNLMAFDARALGNWGCPPDAYPGALDLVLDGKVALAPFVEMHPLADINRVFDAVHHRAIHRRAVLVPDAEVPA